MLQRRNGLSACNADRIAGSCVPVIVLDAVSVSQINLARRLLLAGLAGGAILLDIRRRNLCNSRVLGSDWVDNAAKHRWERHATATSFRCCAGGGQRRLAGL